MKAKIIITLLGIAVLSTKPCYSKKFTLIPGKLSTVSGQLRSFDKLQKNIVNRTSNKNLLTYSNFVYHNNPSTGSNAKATSMGSRITDITSFSYDAYGVDTLEDTSHYTYTGENGGTLDDRFMAFDQGTTYNSQYLLATERQSQTVTKGFVDDQTTVAWNGSGWVNSQYVSNSYDANGNYRSYYNQVWGGSSWVNDEKFVYNYSSTNVFLDATEYVWNGTSWGEDYKYVYTYDNNGRLSFVTVYEWIAATHSWSNYYLDNFTYDNAGNVLTETLQGWSSGVWVNIDKFVNTYHPNNTLDHEYYYTWNSGTNSWVNGWQEVYGYDLSNNLTSEIHSTWNGSAYIDETQRTASYNTLNQVTCYTDYTWDGAAWANTEGISRYVYYYESYPKSTGINNIQVDNELTLFPVPAQNELHVIITRSTAENAHFAIVDVYGKMVKNWSDPVSNNYQKNIPVGDLASGCYFLQVVGGKSSITKQFTITR